MTRDAIRLENMVFYGFHGTKPSEAEQGGRFHVDLVLRGDLSKAGKSDKLEDTVDYERAFNIVRELVEGKRFNLMEALAEAVAGALLRDLRGLSEVEVRIRKPGVPLRGTLDYAQVEIVRSR